MKYSHFMWLLEFLLESTCSSVNIFYRTDIHINIAICLGESDVAEAVIEESEAQGQYAHQFLEDVRLSFPQVT